MTADMKTALRAETIALPALRTGKATGGKTVDEAMAWAFPTVTPFLRPLGNWIVVQLRVPPKSVGSGLILMTDSAKEAEQYDTQIAKVVALGPAVYRNRVTGDRWPEAADPAARANPGDFVRVPRAGLDRWLQPVKGREEPVMLALVRDTDLRGIWAGDPLWIDTARSGW